MGLRWARRCRTSTWSGPAELTVPRATVVRRPFTRSVRQLGHAELSVGSRRFAIHSEFTAIFEHDGDWIVAYCPEIPGANGQGRTKDEARKSLSEAIALILEDRRADALRGVPGDAERGTVTVE